MLLAQQALETGVPFLEPIIKKIIIAFCLISLPDRISPTDICVLHALFRRGNCKEKRGERNLQRLFWRSSLFSTDESS